MFLKSFKVKAACKVSSSSSSSSAFESLRSCCLNLKSARGRFKLSDDVCGTGIVSTAEPFATHALYYGALSTDRESAKEVAGPVLTMFVIGRTTWGILTRKATNLVLFVIGSQSQDSQFCLMAS